MKLTKHNVEQIVRGYLIYELESRISRSAHEQQISHLLSQLPPPLAVVIDSLPLSQYLSRLFIIGSCINSIGILKMTEVMDRYNFLPYKTYLIFSRAFMISRPVNLS
jgi:hypothetical protein